MFKFNTITKIVYSSVRFRTTTNDVNTEGSKNVPESRPRFRRSKLSGMNLHRHPRGISNNWVNPTLGMEDTGFEPLRINDMAPRQVRLRACLKDLYGIRTSRISGKTVIRASQRWIYKSGLLDQRLDVLMQRGGLSNSISQARQRIRHGHVQINGVVSKKPRYVVNVNDVVHIENKYWVQQHKFITVHWFNWKKVINTLDRSRNIDTSSKNVNKTRLTQSTKITYRVVPPYLEVDYVNGAMSLVYIPTIDSTLLPAGLGKSAQVCLPIKS